MEVATVGLDLAKRVFQVHTVNAKGAVVLRKAMRRGQMLPFVAKLPPCLIGMEACGTSHYWARELIRLGHDACLMPSAYVKPYVKRGKTDATDAQAICEAVTRPTMRFVAVKSAEQQAALSLHRTRDLLVRQRIQLVNMIRGMLAEFGIVLADGVERALGLARQIHTHEAVPDVPATAQEVLSLLGGQVLDTHARVRAIDRSLLALHTRHLASFGMCDVSEVLGAGLHCVPSTECPQHGWIGLSFQDIPQERRIHIDPPTQASGLLPVAQGVSGQDMISDLECQVAGKEELKDLSINRVATLMLDDCAQTTRLLLSQGKLNHRSSDVPRDVLMTNEIMVRAMI
jgi:hypothetical protein